MRPGSLGVVFQVVVGVGLLCGEVATRVWQPQDECTFSPSAANAISMECQFNSDEIFIRPTMQYSIESFRITRGQTVYLNTEALVKFKHLRSIHMTGIKILSIRQNSLLQIKKQNAISLTVEQVDRVILEPGALSDWQNPGSKISLKNIGALTVSKQALASSSTFQDVMIENVPSLHMARESVQANITYLRLLNVPHLVCQPNSFSGHIRHMSLVSVTSKKLHSGCIRGKPGWKSLTVHSSHLGNVMKSGIQGAIEGIQIEDSTLGNVAKGGIDVEVSRFSLSSCDISKLGETALQVRAHRYISLHTLRVNTLQRNALRGLKILRSRDYRGPGDQRPQICLSALNVDTLAKDALQLDKDSPVSRYGRVCHSKSRQAQRHRQCIVGDREALVSLKVFRSRCCFGGVGSKSPACPTYEWVPYVAAAAGVVLLAAGALLCYRRRLRAERWPVVRRGGQPRVSMVPSLGGLGNDASDHGSSKCVFQGTKGGPETTGSDTEFVFYKGAEHVEGNNSEEVNQKASSDVQPPEDREETEASVPDTSKAASRQVDKDQGAQNRSKKTKSAPKPPPGHSTAESAQLFEPKQLAPVYAEVTKKWKRARTCGQPTHQVASSTDASGNEKTPSRTPSDNDGDATESEGTVSTAFSGKSSAGGRRQPDVVWADGFNSLPRVPTAEPAAHHRKRSTADSALYDDVYYALGTVRTHNSGPDAASKCSAEYDETYGDLPIAAKNSNAGSRRSLMRFPLYGEEPGGPHTGNSRGGHDAGAVRHTRRSAESPLHAEVNDGRPVTSNDCTVLLERYMYMEMSEGDRSGGPGRTASTSCLCADRSDFPPTVKRGTVPRKANALEIPSYATVFKKKRDPKGVENSKPEAGFH